MAITQEEYLKLNEKMVEIRPDDTPRAVVHDGQVDVVGDPNKTEDRKHDYTLEYFVPKSQAYKYSKEDIVEVLEDYIIVEVEHKDVTLVARRMQTVQAAIAKIVPFFMKLEDDGRIDDLTEEEQIERVQLFDREITDEAYEVVSAILNIPLEAGYMITPSSVYDHLIKFMDDFPDAFNGGDYLFGSSTVKA